MSDLDPSVVGVSTQLDERAQARFWAKVTKTTSCWLWTGARSQGYGSFRHGGRSLRAHIVAYELLHSVVPTGLVLDHVCHNDTDCAGGTTCQHRACVNPAHLEPVTRGENVLRSSNTVRIGEFHRAKTHCPHGHPYAGANLHIRPDGARSCRACGRDRAQRRRSAA